MGQSASPIRTKSYPACLLTLPTDYGGGGQYSTTSYGAQGGAGGGGFMGGSQGGSQSNTAGKVNKIIFLGYYVLL